MAEAICYGPQALCTFSADVSKMQDPDHSSARPFLRIVFAAGNLGGRGNLPSWTKSRLSSSFFRAPPQAQSSFLNAQESIHSGLCITPWDLGTQGSGTHISHISHNSIFLNGSLRVKEIKAKINKWNLIKLKSFLHSKGNQQQNEKTTYWMGQSFCIWHNWWRLLFNI